MAMISRNKEGLREILDFGDGASLKFLFHNSWYWNFEFFAYVENQIISKDQNGEFYLCSFEETHLPENFPKLSFMELAGASQFFKITKVTYRKRFCEIK